jgi:hypothetical protein
MLNTRRLKSLLSLQKLNSGTYDFDALEYDCSDGNCIFIDTEKRIALEERDLEFLAQIGKEM